MVDGYRSDWVQLELRILKSESVKGGDSVTALLQRMGVHLQPQETIWVVAIGPQLDLRTVFEAGRDMHIGVNLHLPTMIAGIALAGAERFYVAHNHPSDDLTPTEGDLQLTSWVNEVSKICGMWLEDHLILTPSGGVYSFAAAGLHEPGDYAAQGGTPMPAADRQIPKRDGTPSPARGFPCIADGGCGKVLRTAARAAVHGEDGHVMATNYAPA